MAKVTGYDGQTEGGDAISIKIQNQAEGEMVLQNIYGAGQTSKLIGNNNIYVNDASITGGNTQTTSSTEDSSTIAEYGNIFGGGHGENSGDITVTESSNVIIEGINTKVGSYGSTELGTVNKEVYVTFKDYWTGNETAKKDSQGNDVGISDIENLIILSRKWNQNIS